MLQPGGAASAGVAITTVLAKAAIVATATTTMRRRLPVSHRFMIYLLPRSPVLIDDPRIELRRYSSRGLGLSRHECVHSGLSRHGLGWLTLNGIGRPSPLPAEQEYGRHQCRVGDQRDHQPALPRSARRGDDRPE